MKRNAGKKPGFFGYDGDFYAWTGKLFDMLAVSIYWLLGSLPVLTMGASFAALHAAVSRSIGKDEGSVTSVFWRSYRQNLKPSLILWPGATAVLALLLLNIGILLHTMNTHLGWFLVALYGVLGVMLLTALCYLFPAVSRFEMPLGWYCKLSLYLVVRHLPISAMLAVLLGTGYLLVLKNPLFALAVPGVFAWIASLMVDPVLDRHAPKTEEPNT